MCPFLGTLSFVSMFLFPFGTKQEAIWNLEVETSPFGGISQGNLMDEDAARHRPDQNGPAELAEGPLERSFAAWHGKHSADR